MVAEPSGPSTGSHQRSDPHLSSWTPDTASAMAGTEPENVVKEEYQCPKYRMSGFATLREAAEHCEDTPGEPGPQREGEETASAATSVDTQMLVDEIRLLRNENKTFQHMQMSVNAEDRFQIRKIRDDIVSEVLGIVSNVTDAIRGELSAEREKTDSWRRTSHG